MKVLMIDNFDSFTFNLVQYFEKAGCEAVTYRNDSGLSVVEDVKPDLLVISPGPSSPKNAGMSMKLVRGYAGKIPIFGVCLGMQVIAEVFGNPVGRLDEIVHGGASEILHDGKTIFKGLPNPFNAGRYHSLGIYKVNEDSPLEISASTGNPCDSGLPFIMGMKPKVVMGLRHKGYPIEGVQFHPESVLTMEDDVGLRLIQNVVKYFSMFREDSSMPKPDG